MVAALPRPGSAATVRRTLESYALLATETLRSNGLTALGGDLGVVRGTLRATGVLTAPTSQIVADAVDVAAGSSCAAVLANTAAGPAPGCPLAGAVAGDVVDDVATACGMPSPFPACDGAMRITVASGETRSLAPGVYGDVVVAGGGAPGTLELVGGRYVICSLRAYRGARLVFHAPSEMHVAGNLRLARDSSAGPAPGGVLSPPDLRVFVAGRGVRFGRNAQVAARVCAPAAVLNAREGTLDGTFVARRIRADRVTVAAPYTETREPCAAHNRLRNVYFGDLHVHTTLSFDAHAFDVQTTQADGYRFARGEPLALPPLDAGGQGTQILQLERPLDFAAITDHSEFLGEVEACSVPGSPGYDSPSCQLYRTGGNVPVTHFGVQLAMTPPTRLTDVCGADNQSCLALASTVWDRVQQAAEGAYDRSAQCAFTSFVAYEYTGTNAVSTLHRNVIFRNDHVPFPTSFFEEPTPHGLWSALETTCRDGGTGCDVLVIPHNSNESNGKMFLVEYPGAGTLAEERAQAELQAAMEPLVEIYQHKGDSECSNGLSGIAGAPDEACEFEKRRRAPFMDCGDGVGVLGTITLGCVSRRDFVRGALLEGLKETERLGTNPLRLGVVAGTDTHNGTPGATEEQAFIGHRGADDDTPQTRLGPGQFYLGGYRFSPGGLTGVWAEENSRPSLFDALRRREVFGTSGTRLSVRLFGGWTLPGGLCGDPDMLRTAYTEGVPMGSFLGSPRSGAAAPSFLVAALRDPGTLAHPGTSLQQVQIVKGWLAGGEAHQQIFDVAGDPDNGATVDDTTCVPSGPGADSLCTVWTDPTFDPAQHAFYYARVLENPTCRWSTSTCNALPLAGRPASCTDPTVPRTIQERAWTSPIWYQPET